MISLMDVLKLTGSLEMRGYKITGTTIFQDLTKYFIMIFHNLGQYRTVVHLIKATLFALKLRPHLIERWPLVRGRSKYLDNSGTDL